MRVLFVAREYPPFEVGGVATHTYNLVINLKKLGISCRVISFGKSEASTPEVTFIQPSSSIISKSDCSVTMDSKIPLDILRLTNIANHVIKSEKFDVIHIQEPYVGAFIRHKRKVTTIHDTSHGEVLSLIRDRPNFQNFKRIVFYLTLGIFFEVMSADSSNFIITPSKQVELELLETYKLSKGKINVIRNGVNIPDFSTLYSKSAAKEKLNLPPDKLLIFSASQHVARKKLDVLLKAVYILKKRNIGAFQVIIAGDGPLRENLLSITKKFGIQDVVHLPGWVTPEQLDLYRQATDIFVMTSEYEAGPISLLEAMSFGNAVVSSRIAGFPRLMVENVDGLLFEPGDHLALSNHLWTLISDTDLREKFSKASVSFAKKFDWKGVAKDTLNIYEKLSR